MRVGRAIEAHNTIAVTVCLALGAGSRGSIQLDGQPESQAGGLLALSHADAVENLERVNLWYALVLCETSIGLSTGLPSSVPTDVCTCWPLLSMSSHSPLFFQHRASVEGTFSIQSLSVRPCIPAKIFILLTLSFRVEAVSPRLI